MKHHIFYNLISNADVEPSNVFCVMRGDDGEEVLTCGDALDRAGRVQAMLKSRGVDRGDVVALMLDGQVDVMTAFVGVSLMGAIPTVMPLNTQKQNPETFWSSHAKLFERTGVRAVVTTAAGLKNINDWMTGSAHQLGFLLLDHADCGSFDPDRTITEVDHDDIALLQHSSGTTGLKKGVALSHGAVMEQIVSYAESIGLTKDDKIATWLPLYHDMGLLSSFIMPAVIGSPIVAIDPFRWVMEPHSIFSMIHDHGCQFTWFPNFAFEHLVRTDRGDEVYDLGGMKAFISCSEPCKKETFERFQKAFVRHGVRAEQLQTCYAMAETVFAVTQSQVNQPVRAAPQDMPQFADGFTISNTVSVGRPISGMQVRIVDPDFNQLPEGQCGQIAVKAPYLFSAYYRLPDETAAAFVDGWYLTGDIGTLVDGELFIIGRIKDVIVVNGKNIVAHEVEADVSRISGVKPGRAVAFGVYSDRVGSEELVIVAERDGPLSDHERAISAEIRECVMSSCGIYPARVRLVEPGWLVKTTSGKISRSDNHRKYLSELSP